MPWARLHAAKDYYSMAAILEEYPAIHQTFNLTPSLLEQIEDYLQGSEDYYQRVMKEAEKLTPWEKRFLLHHYFDIQWDRVIARHPRYHQLLNLQGRTREPEAVREALERFTTRDYRDLQAWFNLAWMDPDLRRKDPFLNGLEEKGEGFTVQEVKTLMEKQMEILRRVVPEHRRLMERKQIEIITTPFYHPIMPLIIDSHSALRASPGLPLPGHRFRYPEDAYAQLKLSREQYRRLFGTLPRGVWPPEQAVSPECIPIFNDLGFAWTISDEQVLARSLDVEIVRDGYGHVLNGDVLYRPYQVKAEGGEITMIFRDHHLSDRIGFEYPALPSRGGRRRPGPPPEPDLGESAMVSPGTPGDHLPGRGERLGMVPGRQGAVPAQPLPAPLRRKAPTLRHRQRVPGQISAPAANQPPFYRLLGGPQPGPLDRHRREKCLVEPAGRGPPSH